MFWWCFIWSVSAEFLWTNSQSKSQPICQLHILESLSTETNHKKELHSGSVRCLTRHVLYCLALPFLSSLPPLSNSTIQYSWRICSTTNTLILLHSVPFLVCKLACSLGYSDSQPPALWNKWHINWATGTVQTDDRNHSQQMAAFQQVLHIRGSNFKAQHFSKVAGWSRWPWPTQNGLSAIGAKRHSGKICVPLTLMSSTWRWQ